MPVIWKKGEMGEKKKKKKKRGRRHIGKTTTMNLFPSG